MTDKPRCQFCDNTGWVCENHPDKPSGDFSDRSDACQCGAGAPCPHCNSSGNPPDMSRIRLQGRR